jgi:hypothetical protein
MSDDWLGMSSGMDNARGTDFEEVSNDAKDSLVFPTDMTKQFYPEAIKFSIYERSGVSYDVTKDKIVNAAQSHYEFISADKDLFTAKRKAEELAKNSGKSDKANGEFQSAHNKVVKAADVLEQKTKKKDAETGELKKHTMTIPEKYQEEQSLKKTQDRLIQSIYLAMPESVNFAEGVEWQGTDLGVIGGARSGAIVKSNALDYGVLTGAGAALGGAAGLGASMIPGISGIAGTVLGAVLGNNTIQTGIESTLGVKTNPFKEQTFQGVGFRPFDFTFRFIARDQTDVKTIQNILSAFRSYSKPTFKEGSQGSIFKYPHEFRIEFLTFDDNDSVENYITNPYLPEIKFCICQTVNTNFTAAGWRSFEGGAPTDITVQMTFQETEIITGEDVFGNTTEGRFKNYKGAGKGRF